MVRFYQVDGKTVQLDCSALAGWRAANGLTLEDVADHCGCTRAAVSAWECGVSAPRRTVAAERLIRRWHKELRAAGALRDVHVKGKVAA